MTVNTIVNPGFETGDLTGWTASGSTDGGAPINASYANGSNYGCQVHTSVGYGYPSTGDYYEIEQPLTLDSNIANITFDFERQMSSSNLHSCTCTVELRQNGTNWTTIFSTTINIGPRDSSFTTQTITKATILAAGITLANVDRIRFKKVTN